MLWDSEAEYAMVAILLDREGFNIYGVRGRERGKSNKNAGFNLVYRHRRMLSRRPRCRDGSLGLALPKSALSTRSLLLSN